MDITWLPDATPRSRRLAVGEFDGVHVGHREVIRGSDTVMTFEPHPRTVVAPQSAPKLLTTLEQKADLIAALGVQELIVIPFDGERMSQPAQDFIDQELVARLGATLVSVGEDFRFGHRAKGDTALLAGPGRVRDAGRADGRDSTARSSPRRTSARWSPAGAVAEAARLLGAPFGMRGIVQHGDKRGRTLGFPTANLVPDPALAVPDHGIYAGPRRGAGAGGVDRGGLDRRPADVRHRPRPARRGLPARLRRRHLRPRTAARLRRRGSAASGGSSPPRR